MSNLPYSTDPMALTVTSDDSILLTGTTEGGKVGSDDVLLQRLSSSGSQLWDTAFGGGNHDAGIAIAATDQVTVIAGWTNSYGNGTWIVGADPEGNKLWTTDILPGLGAANAVVAGAFGGVFIAGRHRPSLSEPQEALLAWISLDGQLSCVP